MGVLPQVLVRGNTVQKFSLSDTSMSFNTYRTPAVYNTMKQEITARKHLPEPDINEEAVFFNAVMLF